MHRVALFILYFTQDESYEYSCGISGWAQKVSEASQDLLPWCLQPNLVDVFCIVEAPWKPDGNFWPFEIQTLC